ncbi:hypothetical protein E4H12_08905 [Candidatus Thorarchaeota archaeon]|nr:MAG: hypothetical protein E4H12_08905 [Candidatus Thorarchaeota archaeon]
MEILKVRNKKLIVVNIVKLAFVFLVPVQFDMSIGTEGTSYGISSQSYSILTWTGLLRFRWIIVQYPISLILALVALIFTIRLHQLQGKSYPIRSAFVVGLVLSIIPIYYFIQFFLVSNLYWFDIVRTAPVFIGFCSSLFLIFVVLPSISWYSNSLSADRSLSKREDDQERGEKKRTILTPKTSSYLTFLAAFLLPGMMILQSTISIDNAYQSISLIGFLLQFSFGLSTDLSHLGLYYTLQDIISWNLFGVPIICCAASLVFAWTIMRYVHGKGTKRIAILVGFLSEIPPILFTIGGLTYAQVWLILPLPVVLVVGLLVLRFAKAIEPSRKSIELDQSVIKVPLKFRMKSHLFRQLKKSDETPIESSDAGDEEAQ